MAPSAMCALSKGSADRLQKASPQNLAYLGWSLAPRSIAVPAAVSLAVSGGPHLIASPLGHHAHSCSRIQWLNHAFERRRRQRVWINRCP